MFLLKCTENLALEKIWTSSSMTAALCHDAYNTINQLFNLHTGAKTNKAAYYAFFKTSSQIPLFSCLFP